MEEAVPTAPPVVAVVVAHEPGDWFEDVITGLAAQDYPNLRTLFLDTGPSGELADRIGDRIPGAFVRHLDDFGSFGATANEVLQLVEGSGFFCLLHDDVALEPDAIRLLVEETYRSNAGIVGPKLVLWEDPEHLLEVGSSSDKFGTPAPLVEPGELDQEQHDGVLDVFFVPSACLLVRTDLFRALGGFDEAMPFYGDDLDLCWRAHVAGARVLAVPGARGRHRGRLPERLPQVDKARMSARHRLRSVLGNYSPAHLLRVVPQHLFLSVTLAIVGLFTGRAHVARSELGAWPWNLARWSDLRAKRRQVKATRLVPDQEVRTLQVHGSARLSAFFRGRAASGERLSSVSAAGRNLANSFRGGAPRSSIVAWIALVVLFLLGCRSLITDGVAAVGTLLPYPSSAIDLLKGYLMPWNAHGLGSGTALPTGLAFLGLGGLLAFGQMALLRTLLVVLPILVGYLGAWWLARPFGSQRGKLASVVVYAAMPLGYNAIATGRWAGVLAYGAMPWIVLLLARMSRLAPFDRSGVPTRPFVARVAGLAIAVAVVTAFVPSFPLVVVLTAVALVLGTLPVGGFTAMAKTLFGAVLASAAALLLLHLPWGWSLPIRGNWATVVGIKTPGGDRLGFSALARFSTGPVGTWWLGWAFLVVVVAALLLGRSERLAWTSRAAGVLIVFVALAWLGDRGSLPLGLPAIEVVLAPAAVGVALAAAAGAAAVERDVSGTSLSWRQPLGSLAVVAVALSVLPALLAVTDGRWKLGTQDFADSFAFLPTQRQAGDFRVLWVGDPRNLPGTPWKLSDGVGYSLSEDGTPQVRDLWALGPTDAEQLVAQALQLASDGQTTRLGRLLGPMGVRYLVVPSERAPSSENTPSHPAPSGLTAALASQLDLKEVDLDDALTVYENTTWLPIRSQLSPAAAAASAEAGFDRLVRADLSGSTAILDQSDGVLGHKGSVAAGTVFLGESSSSGWRLEVNGKAATRTPAFGWANAFDVPTGGTATLTYQPSTLRWLVVAAQLAFWILAIWLATRTGVRRVRRSAASGPSSTLIDLGVGAGAALPAAVGATAGGRERAGTTGGGGPGPATPLGPPGPSSGPASDTELAPPTPGPSPGPVPEPPPAPSGEEEDAVRWGADSPRHDEPDWGDP